MEIVAFSFEQDRCATFLDFPARLYEGDANWLPPSRDEQARLLSPANRFFSHGEHRAFLALREGRPVGRCAAFWNRDLRDPEGQPCGTVGMFECEQDGEAASALFAAAHAWLRERGLTRVWGPMDFSIWHRYRLMVRGFDAKTFLGEPYNPAYYPELWQAAGYATLARWFSWDLTREHMIGMRAAAKAQVAALGHAPPQRTIDIEQFDDELRVVHRLLVEGFVDNLGATPIDFEEFAPLYSPLRAIIDPDFVPMTLDEAGEPMAFGLLYPDPSDLIRAQRGLAAPAPPDCLIFHTMVVQESHRKRGPMYGPVVTLIDHALAKGLTRGVGALVKEGPALYAKTGAPSREYALYSRDL